MEFCKKYKEQFNTKDIENLAKRFDLSPDIIKLLFSRNIDTEEKYIGDSKLRIALPEKRTSTIICYKRKDETD